MALDTKFITNITNAVKSLLDADKVTIGNAIFTSDFDVRNIEQYHWVMDDVRDGSPIVIMPGENPYGSLEASSGCSMNACDFDDEYVRKKWTIGAYDCRIPLCVNTLSDDFKLFWGMYRQGLENPLTEPDKDAFITYLTNRAGLRVAGAMWRTAYFGDKGAASNKLINQNDGFFTQLEAGDGDKVTLTAVDQSNPTGEELYKAIKEAYTIARRSPWYDETKLRWKMTDRAAELIVQMFNDAEDLSQYNCQCIDPAKMSGSRAYTSDNLRLFGIPVDAYREIDGSGLVIKEKNLFKVVLIREDNFLLGTNLEETMKQFDIFYDKKDRMIYIDMMINVGALVPRDEYVYITNQVT